MTIVEIREGGLDRLGFLPMFLDEDDRRPVVEQFNDRYAHGGGWRPQGGFKLLADGSLKYPGDAPMKPYVMIMFHGETIVVYDYGYVSVTDRDKKLQICRMD